MQGSSYSSKRTSDVRVHGQNNSGETVCCLVNDIFIDTDDSRSVEPMQGLTLSFVDEWIADSGAPFHIKHSVDQ